MPLNIRSREVDELAARLAQKLGTTKTEAVRRALTRALERDEPKAPLAERIRDIQDRIAARGKTGLKADKAFYDWLSE